MKMCGMRTQGTKMLWTNRWVNSNECHPVYCQSHSSSIQGVHVGNRTVQVSNEGANNMRVKFDKKYQNMMCVTGESE